MRALLTLTSTLALAALLVTCVGDPPPRFVQPEACAVALQCYFGEPGNQLSTVPGFEGLVPEGDPALVQDVYGPEGRCWRGGPELATSCEDRCKGLLWQDCAASYNRACTDTGAVCLADADCPGAGAGEGEGEGEPAIRCEPERVPFCGEAACAVANALPCSFEDFASVGGQRQANAPLFSACPDEAVCNAETPPFAGNQRPNPRFGCCDLPKHVDAAGVAAPLLIGNVPDGAAAEQPCATIPAPR